MAKAQCKNCSKDATGKDGFCDEHRAQEAGRRLKNVKTKVPPKDRFKKKS